MTRRTFAAMLGLGWAAVPRDVPILSGRVSGRTPADVEDGIFDLARGSAIAVPPGSAAHRALEGLLGMDVDVVMRVKN